MIQPCMDPKAFHAASWLTCVGVCAVAVGTELFLLWQCAMFLLVSFMLVPIHTWHRRH